MFKTAGFFIRLAALIVDEAFLFVLTLPSLILYTLNILDDLVTGSALSEAFRASLNPTTITIWMGFYTLYILGFWIWKNATPGKMLLKIKIVDARTGQDPNLGQYIVRYIGYFVSALPLCIGFVWAAFDKKKQGWPDKIARTLVVFVE